MENCDEKWIHFLQECYDGNSDDGARGVDGLLAAAMIGNTEMVKRMLGETDFRLNRQDVTENALAYAAAKGHVEVVQILLDATKEIPYRENCSWALEIAASRGYIEIVKKLLKNEKCNPANSNALRNAVNGGHIEIIKILIEDGRKKPYYYGCSPVELAAENGYTEIMKLLLDARIYMYDDVFKALKRAKSRGHYEIVKLLENYRGSR